MSPESGYRFQDNDMLKNKELERGSDFIRRLSALAGCDAGTGRTLYFFRSWDQAFALQLLARLLAVAPDGFGMLACTLLRRLLIGGVRLGFPEDALALHFLLQHTQCLVDVVVSYEYLQKVVSFSFGAGVTPLSKARLIRSNEAPYLLFLRMSAEAGYCFWRICVSVSSWS
jgi:hypothetical protein